MKFSGCYTALATPFKKDFTIDEPALRKLIHFQIQNGVAGLVPCGSTGEAATLTHEEFRRLISITVAESAGKVPVIAGISANATAKAVDLAEEAQSLKADALLVLTPYYNKPGQEGLYQHFRAVAQSTKLPIMAYNIPGRTAVNVMPKTLARLAEDCSNIVAVKEAAGSLDQVSEMMTLAPEDFTVLSGDDSLTLPMMAAGARGVVSVLSNIAPKAVSELCRLFAAGKSSKARELHLKMFPLIKALFIETNPIPIKAALSLMGFGLDIPRLPLTPLEPRNRSLLKSEMKRFGLL